MQIRKKLFKFSSTASTAATTENSKKSQPIPSTQETTDLATRFGVPQKHLGRGNDGVVSAFRRASDGALFAVKQYRPRRASESKTSYQATLTAEYAICHDLSHGNIIKLHDLVSEKGVWYQVMECAPFDLFAAVMQGAMGRAEADCCFRQVVEGVQFLHAAGIAHRDLKLDNIVVTREGIMKIIDFGSAVRFRCQVTGKVILCQGISGSMPYLAPEVFTLIPYDPRAADIWSLAVIYYALVLRRLPWKSARISDLSYARFVGAVAQSVSEPRKASIAANEPIRLTIRETRAPVPAGPRRASEAAVPITTTRPSESRKPSSVTPSTIPSNSVISLMPTVTRPLMSHMFTISPKHRATMADLTSDAWLNSVRFCNEDAETGLATRCAGEDEQGREGHVHTLVRAT